MSKSGDAPFSFPCTTTNDTSCMFNARPPPSRPHQGLRIGNGKTRQVQVGNIDVVLHGETDELITLCDVSYLPVYHIWSSILPRTIRHKKLTQSLWIG